MRSGHQAVVGLVLLLASAANVQSGRQSLYKFGSPKALQIATIEGAEYLGCYRDSWWSRQLEKQLYSSKSNSPAKCGAHCREAGYTYFGLQVNSFNPRYSQCFCGNTLGTERKRPEEECYSKCPDDPSQICGGNWRQTLYRFLSFGKATPTPVVLWHGLASDSKDRRYITRDKELIETKISGIYVKSLQIPEQKFFITDGKQKFLETLASITMPINRQVELACRQIANDPRLQNGYNAIGYSQGGLLMRAVAQRCPNPPMRNLITMGSPHQGVNGMKHLCTLLKPWVRFLLILLSGSPSATCTDNTPIINRNVYKPFWQKVLAPTQYWHNPLAPKTYAMKSRFLADINMEGENPNETYADNLKKLKKLVFVDYQNEQVVEPRESVQFKFYKVGSDTEIVDFDYPSVTTGLKGALTDMRSDGKIDYVQVPGRGHIQHSPQWFEDNIIIRYLKEDKIDQP